MHELAICQGLIDAAQHIAQRENATGVVGLTVKIGALSGVEPFLLVRAFEVARMGTIAQGAELVIESMPVRVACESCGAQSQVVPQRLLCDRCGGWHVRIVAGEELLLSRVELEHDTAVERRGCAPPDCRTRTSG
jgi:hydrogenase nickel incorporation protein HypA/HybF